MALVFVDDLTVGMVLAEDLFTPKGRFILAGGMTLQDEHLGILKSWGVFEVNISDASLGEKFQQQQTVGAEQEEMAETYLWRRLALNDLEQEPVATIYRHAVRHFAESFQKGWEPVSFKLSEPPPEDEEKPVQVSVPQLLQGNTDLLSLPTVYSHIVATLNRSDSTSSQIAEAISKDAALTIRLLRLVNSPIYGFPGKIDSVPRAVSLLGVDELSSLALGVAVVSQFTDIPPTLIDMDSFWRHSIRCGLFAKELAEQLGEQGTERYFTGGLLHDIGRLIMLLQIPELYCRAVFHGRRNQLPMYRAELGFLQTDHCAVGKILVMRWRLPMELIRMIGGHHDPKVNHYAIESSLLHVADILAHVFGAEVNLVNEVPPLQQKAWEATGLTKEALAPVIRKVESEFSHIIRIFFGGTSADQS